MKNPKLRVAASTTKKPKTTFSRFTVAPPPRTPASYVEGRGGALQPRAGWLVPKSPSAGSHRSYPDRVDLEFSNEVWFWRGPSPYHFVTVLEGESAELQA